MKIYFADLLKGREQESVWTGIYTRRLMESRSDEEMEHYLPYVELCVQMALNPEMNNSTLLRRIQKSPDMTEEEQHMCRLLYDMAEDRFERWDGTGEPYGKRGEAISLTARMLAAARVCDRARNSGEEHLWRQIISRERGTGLDPELADYILRNPEKFR